MSERAMKGSVVRLREVERIEGARTGKIVSHGSGWAMVTFDGCGEPRRARLAVGVEDPSLAAAAQEGADALLVFENGMPDRPVVLALLRSETPLVDALLASGSGRRDRLVTVDGKRVVVEGVEEVALRCGKASLTLRRDGSVTLRGVTVVSQADGVQKIRGGKVQIN